MSDEGRPRCGNPLCLREIAPERRHLIAKAIPDRDLPGRPRAFCDWECIREFASLVMVKSRAQRAGELSR